MLGSAQNNHRDVFGMSESRAQGTGAAYGASNAPRESVKGGGDGAFLAAAAALCAYPRTSMLWCR